MNSDRRVLIAAMTVFAFAFAASFVFGEVNAPETLSEVGSSSRDLSDLSAQSINAQGGNVTEVNIEALTITQSWQGYYGDVTGEITLGDASNNTFYNWSLSSVDGEVFATRASSVTWTNVNCTNSTNITSEETYLGQSASDGDSITNTYTLTTHPAFDVSTSQIITDTCPSTYGYTNNNTQSTNWVQVLLYDFTGNTVIYTTLMNDSTTGFNGGTHDFQLLVGENEHSGSEGVTPYFFWVELE